MRDTRRVERWLLPDLGADARKAPEAIQLKLEKLARDPFTFFRGTLPEYVRRVRASVRGSVYGIEGLITGDLHLENLGTFPTPSGDLAFDLNDFDDAARAPLAVELRRLGTSARLAAQAGAASRCADAVLEGFELGMSSDAIGEPRVVAELLGRCRRLDVGEFISGSTVAAGRGRSLRGLPQGSSDLTELLAPAFRDLRERTPRSLRLSPSFYKVLDAAPRLAGNGSLGRRRYLALLAGDARGEPALVDFKEPRSSPWGASSSLLGASSRALQVERVARAFRDRSERVLGTAHLKGRLFQVREHSPYGLKVAAMKLEPAVLLEYARFCGSVIARAWQRSRQPVARFSRALSASGRGTLREQMRLDAERVLDDHQTFRESRLRIAEQLGLPAPAPQRVA